MTKQRTQKALINIEYKVAKPFVDAGALALGSSAFAVVLQGPALNWGLLGAGFSLFWYWGANNLTKPKRGKKLASPASVGAGSVVVNSVNGIRKVSLGFNYEPRFVSRETFGETLRRLVWGKDDPAPRPGIDKAKPKWLTEYIFISHYNGQEVQLQEEDVSRFLNAAWRYRKWGRGLSKRRWVRDIALRPQWYKNLGASWYHALMELLWEVERLSGRVLLIPVGHQQYALARPPHQTLEALRWAQALKGNEYPPEDVLIIGTDGVSSF